MSLWRETARRVESEVAENVQTGIRLADDRDYEGAQDAYEQALKLAPDQIKALGNLAILKKDLFLSQPWGHADKTHFFARIGDNSAVTTHPTTGRHDHHLKAQP